MCSLITKETKPSVRDPILNLLQKNIIFSDNSSSNEKQKYKDVIVKKIKCDEKYKEYLEIKYVECLKKSYMKKEILENKCESYIKDYINCFSNGTNNFRCVK